MDMRAFLMAGGINPLEGRGVYLPGQTVQAVHTADGEVDTGTTQLPVDNSIPQITEGDEYMTLAITPTNAANKLVIEAAGQFATGNAGANLALALFQDATANALAVSAIPLPSANTNYPLAVKYEMVAGTDVATTFRVRAGTDAAGTTTFNGVAAGRQFGGVSQSYLRITEVKV